LLVRNLNFESNDYPKCYLDYCQINPEDAGSTSLQNIDKLLPDFGHSSQKIILHIKKNAFIYTLDGHAVA
jgi:hypothetical protein